MKPNPTGRRGTHGQSKTPTFKSWQSMRQRCSNPQDSSYANYGSRGITVCPEWNASFERFLADMGPRPSREHSIDRIDNDANYTPDNCRWATRVTQQRNKRNARLLTLDGVTKPLAEWADDLGIKRTTLEQRLYEYGWTVERALTAPVRSKMPDGTHPRYPRRR